MLTAHLRPYQSVVCQLFGPFNIHSSLEWHNYFDITRINYDCKTGGNERVRVFTYLYLFMMGFRNFAIDVCEFCFGNEIISCLYALIIQK